MVETLGVVCHPEVVRSEPREGLKVLHVVPSFYPAHAYGGPIYSVYALCRHLSRQGCSVRVLTTNANGPETVLDVRKDRELELEDGVRIRYCGRLSGDSVSLSFLASLKPYLHWADVVHLTAVYSFPTLPTLTAAKIMKKPVIWSPRGSLHSWSGNRLKTVKQIWNLACRVSMPDKTILHVTSENEGAYSNAKFPGPTAVVIPNGVEVPARAKTMWHNGKLPILFLGRLDPIKAIENLITACSLLRGVDWSLTIAGAGDKSYADRLRNVVHQLNLCDRVRMVGQVVGETKDVLYDQNDLLVLPSHGENFGMAVAEALAYGIPVIASKGTPWSRVEEVGCGLWTNNTPQDLAKAIQQISQMPLQNMGAKGRSWMQADFSWTACAGRMARVYHDFAQS